LSWNDQIDSRCSFLNQGLENCVGGKEIHLKLILNRIIISGEEKMKKITPIFVVLLVMFFVAACASATPATTQEPVQPAATEAPTQSAVTEAPAATEPPTQSGATESVPAGENQVNITLADNTIDASVTSFQVGVPYTFVITNEGQHAHNFNINPPVSVAGSLGQALDSALLVVPQEQLGVGQSTTVEFTFPDTAAGQLLEFSCLIRRHYEDGMKVDITVTQ
jgi:uncharacterized cupredoxin-like copper-binding protein